jgi:vancomycin resistance protein YoaR
VAARLLEQARNGEQDLAVAADATETAPRVTDETAQFLAGQLNLSTSKGLTVQAGTHQAVIPSQVVRSWLGSRVQGSKLEVTMNANAARDALKDAINVDTEPRDATFTLVNNAPTVVPSVDGEKCCAADTPNRILAAILKGSPTVAVDMEIKKPSLTTEAAAKLGVKEPVGAVNVTWKGQPQVKSFTTYFKCCEARVTNIHRIADLIRGTVVLPGETFSVNQTVGQRTVAKGFVTAGAIANGEHVNEVGGGVSQFATTMFNAAFFAGLPFGEYQAHSEHFDRYPFGREATMGYEHPDLQWKNDTPYAILIWTSHTATSVTVQLWSTQYAWGEQTGQSTSRSGSCTNVTTQRTIHYADGRTATDTVRARYRDPGVTRC